MGYRSVQRLSSVAELRPYIGHSGCYRACPKADVSFAASSRRVIQQSGLSFSDAILPSVWSDSVSQSFEWDRQHSGYRQFDRLTDRHLNREKVIFYMTCIRNLLAAVAIVCISTPALAGSIIKVIESGEGGGSMTLRTDQSTIKAGETTFMVHNDAVTEEHEMVLVKLKSADQSIVVDTTKHRINEKKLKSLGEVAELKPGNDGELKTELTPGSYILLCNIKGHYEAGMHAMLTVTK